MKTKHIIAMLCLAATMAVSAQNDSTAVKTKSDSRITMPKWCTPYGFIRTDFFAQTHEMESVVKELMPLYPSPASINEYGEDINQVASAGFYSMTTRLGLKLSGDSVLGAMRIAGCIEADFTAGTNCTSLYLRKAYVQLLWKKSDLIIGQTWHPLCTENLFPKTLSINIGAPYNPFSRNPQLRYTYHLVDRVDAGKVDLLGAIVYQAASTSVGPDGSDTGGQTSSASFQQKAIIPNVYLGGVYSHRQWTAGIGLDYKAINPVKTYTNYEGQQKKNNKLLHTFSAMIYGDYNQDLLDVSAKVIYGSNLCEHKLIGGYAVGQRAVTVDGVEGYVLDLASFGTFSSYVDASYGKLFKGNIFCGYARILSPQKDLNKTYTFYGAGKSGSQITKDIYRIGASFTYNPKHWCFGLEIQYNSARWGTLDNIGKITDLNRSGSFWCDIAAIYSF